MINRCLEKYFNTLSGVGIFITTSLSSSYNGEEYKSLIISELFLTGTLFSVIIFSFIQILISDFTKLHLITICGLVLFCQSFNIGIFIICIARIAKRIYSVYLEIRISIDTTIYTIRHLAEYIARSVSQCTA